MIGLIKKGLKDNHVLSLTNNLAYAILGFFSFIILTRTYEKEIFGQWVLYVTAASFIEMLRFGLTKTAIVRFVSGAEGKEKKSLIGSSWLIGLSVTILIAILLIAILRIFPEDIQKSGYYLWFKWYPLLAFANLPMNNALSVLQAEQRFDRILLVRIFFMGSFVVFLLINILFLELDLYYVIIIHLIITVSASLLCILKNWDGFRYITLSVKETRLRILNFGKFTTGTLIGSNLLKSADTFIISLSPLLGTAGVALYSVPLKLTEILEIPLRSFVATSFPRMSKASMKNNVDKVKELFYTYSGAMTLLFIGIAMFSFIFARELVIILGGREYEAAADIFRVFAIYGLFLPIDRFTGVALDSINKPKRNFYKIIVMALANIIGDLIAVFIFKSLIMVAVVTILFTIVGLLVGSYYLNQEIKMQYRNIFSYGLNFYLQSYRELRKKRN